MLPARTKILDRYIGQDALPYVIAEAGSNFNQSLDTAFALIDAAAAAKADAVKFQLFRAAALYPNGGELYDIFKSVELNAEWLPALADHARKKGLHFLASAFDMDSVAALGALDVPAHKVASSETVNLDLVRAMASYGKPVIISTGMCDMVDVKNAVDACLAVGNDQVILLQCGAQYPLPEELANLRVITSLAAQFGGVVGFSDHTLKNTAAIAAVALGGAVFEKHFTLDRKSDGPDHFYALEPGELSEYVANINAAHIALGSREKDLLPEERRLGRREGVYALRRLIPGDVIDERDIESRRPALGIRARDRDLLIGATVISEVAAGEALHWDQVKEKK